MKVLHTRTNFSMNAWNLNNEKKLVVCIHGNSSTCDTFSYLLSCAENLFYIIAVDLPGCGNSPYLDNNTEYTCQLMMDTVTKVYEFYNPQKIILLGHSLGGHLLAYANDDLRIKGMILIGTPPLQSTEDFARAFTPSEKDKHLIPMLSHGTHFSEKEAELFVGGFAIPCDFKKKMIKAAMNTDPRFRKGCLSTILDKPQKLRKTTAILHATHDSIISLDYLRKLLGTVETNTIYHNDILLLKGDHMSIFFNDESVQKILNVIHELFNL